MVSGTYSVENQGRGRPLPIKNIILIIKKINIILIITTYYF